MINQHHLREYIIQPTLTYLGLYNPSAEELLMLTAATESRLGFYLHQVEGPAIGIFQVEPATHDDIWANFLSYRSSLCYRINNLVPQERRRQASQMAGNLYYATAIARVHYLRDPEPFPEADDIRGLAETWKRVFNTHPGSGTVNKAIDNYRELVE